MSEAAWIANRQVFETLRSELAALRLLCPEQMPPVDHLERGVVDLTALASAGLLDEIALLLSSDRSAGPPLPSFAYILFGIRLRVLPPPVPALQEIVMPSRPLFQSARFSLLFRPSRRFASLPVEQRRRWLQGSALAWAEQGQANRFALARPFRPRQAWRLLDGTYLVKEVSYVGSEL